MPEVGGKQLANDFVSMMADVRKAIDELKKTVADALAELRTEITKGASDSALAIRKEAAAVRQGYATLLGNAPPAGDTERSRKKRPKKSHADPTAPRGGA